MKKLIITADVHGSISSWLTLKNLLDPEDLLMVAGDLYDVRYGNYNNPDFSPDAIKKDLTHFPNRFFYIYGNCDTVSFFPGYDSTLQTTLFNKHIFMHHGHASVKIPQETDILIQGHTHLCFLEKKDRLIHLNPGSITSPRNGLHTYAVMDKKGIRLIALKSGKPLISIDF